MAKQIRRAWAAWSGLQILAPVATPALDKLVDLWPLCRRVIPASNRTKLDGVFLYCTWQIWKEWNGGIFRQEYNLVPSTIYRLKELVRQRVMAFDRWVQDDGG